MKDIRQQLLAVFDLEHREHLAAMRATLAAAAAGGEVDRLDLFRRAHTLKGAARAVDLPAVERVFHRLETVLSEQADEGRALDEPACRGIALALDAVEEAIAAVMHGQPEPDLHEAIEALGQVAQAVAPAGQGGPEGDTPAPRTEGEAESPAPSRPAAAQPQPSSSSQPPQAAPPAASTFLTVAAEAVEQVTGASYELALAVQARQGVDQLYKELQTQLQQLERSWEQLRAAERQALARSDPAKVFQARLRAASRQLASLNLRQRQASWSLAQAAGQLREQIEHLSLVPAETVFGGFARMVREIARSEACEVEFSATGLDLQLDMSLLRVLKDPVMHLLRNAIGHGAEPPEQRRRMGKPAALQITLSLEARGSQLLVRVCDDGRGLDFGKIRQVAAERGLIPPGIAHSLSKEQLSKLLLHPGFSTASEVNKLSGRGIGLSVVQDVVRRLRGHFSVEAGNPWGTIALIRAPLSASRQALLIVEAEGLVYGLPMTAVERVMRIKVEDVGKVGGQPVVEVKRGEEVRPVPLAPLAAAVRGAAGVLPAEAGMINIILMRMGERSHALAVDVLHDAGQFVIAAPELIGTDPAIVAGTVVLPDGSPVPVLRAEGLLEQWDTRSDAASLVRAWEGAEHQRRQATILVVDDSITTRTLEKNLLEAQGFRVLVSVDGVDALATLGEHPEIDLVVADIEMPRMDGFALLEAMKNDARFEAIPVVLMTSRAGPDDIRRGLELGAGAYLTKQKFDQRELLATINQLL
ncbi:hybrid sensor histidine kinase/response regulator [Rhodoligotrophos defluvii]|uniref:hybrid sensor histidine kinase/response regulator n=1 Tax=Rhodoligotrophos defluvii TaxID=2561934 RepID=UPI0010CA027A|nr:response regulator [Rhodoligotrophos defluvii]